METVFESVSIDGGGTTREVELKEWARPLIADLLVVDGDHECAQGTLVSCLVTPSLNDQSAALDNISVLDYAQERGATHRRRRAASGPLRHSSVFCQPRSLAQALQ